jgi:ATP-binding cassette subfamily B protein
VAARLGRGASVLVLDEPTAALDVRLEHDLFERFGRLGQGATTLLISHRFSTVRMADRVAMMEDGAVAEEGTHEELVAAGGPYAELYDLQARRFA